MHGGILINPVPCLSARVLGAKGEDHEVLHLTGEVVDVPQCDEWVIAAEWRPIMVVILDAQPGADHQPQRVEGLEPAPQIVLG